MYAKKIICTLIFLTSLTSNIVTCVGSLPDTFETSCICCQQKISSAGRTEFDKAHKEHILNCKAIPHARSKNDAWSMAKSYALIIKLKNTSSNNSYRTVSNAFESYPISNNCTLSESISKLRHNTKSSQSFWAALQEDHKKNPILAEQVLYYYRFLDIDNFYTNFYIDTKSVMRNIIIDLQLGIDLESDFKILNSAQTDTE